MLYVVQVQQTIEPASLAELRQRFDRSDLRIYDINVEGMKHRYPARHEAVANLCPGVPGPAMSLAGTGKREQTSMPYRFIRTLCLDKSTGDYAASIGNQPGDTTNARLPGQPHSGRRAARAVGATSASCGQGLSGCRHPPAHGEALCLRRLPALPRVRRGSPFDQPARGFLRA